VPSRISSHDFFNIQPTHTNNSQALQEKCSRKGSTPDLIAQISFTFIDANSGGLRKVRFPCKNAGKSGGLRVIYMYRDLNMPLYLIAAYEKTKKSRYTERELSAMRSLCTQIVNEHAAQNIRKINGSWSA